MSQKTEKNNKKSRKRILLCFLLFFGVFASYFSPQSASSSGGSMTVEKKKLHAKNKQKQMITGKNGKFFACFDLPESYYIKEETFPFHALECDEAYTIYETRTEEKVASIETGVNLFNIYRGYYGDDDYHFEEKVNQYGIRYLLQKNKKKYQKMFYIPDSFGNSILIFDFNTERVEEDILNSLKPVKENFGFIHKQDSVLKTIKKNNKKQERILYCFALFLIWILNAIGKCRFFKKMGEERWKAFIPVYSDKIIFGHVWNIKGFIFYYISLVFLLICNYFNNTVLMDKTEKNILEFLLMICFFWFLFVFCKYIGYLCDAFKKKRRFFILALLCMPMAYFLLGKKKVMYIGNMYSKKRRKGDEEQEEQI